MILHKLTLNNFGLFRGSQTIQLTPNGTGPIILIGGMNGSGKTTLLDAVRLCLYGRRSLGARVSSNEYHEYLSSMIHRNPPSDLPLNYASVSLDFEYARGGEKKQYRVERVWRQHGKSSSTIKEDLTVYQDNRLDLESDGSHFQDHINELIPAGVSQFFFFDGEDIQKLVDDSSHDDFLAESVKALLGLNLVDRLHSDLRIYANRLIKRGSPVAVQEEIIQLESEIASLRKPLADLEEHREVLLSKIEKSEAQIAHQESHIAAEGGSYAEKKENLNLRHGQLLADIEALENEIRDLCERLFPFSLVPELLNKLKDRLLKEIKLNEWEAESRALRKRNKQLLESIDSDTFWDDETFSDVPIDAVRAKIAALLKKRRNHPKELQEFKTIRDRSSSEYRYLLDWIDICLNEIPQEFLALTNSLKETQSELQKVEEDLQKVPAEEVLKPMIEKLSTLNQKLGQFNKELLTTEDSIRSLTYQIKIAGRKLEKLYVSQQLGQAHIRRQEQVREVRSVLSTYTNELTQTKVSALSDAIVETINYLSHKPDRIRRVHINPETFGVTLYDTYNQPLAKEELSAGEKQIYTIALLWSLAKISGKPLPMILDTPLGRLDTIHRQLLIEHYFPYVSHQAILLSTNTEIVGDLLSLLTPYISHTFHLMYQQTEGYTTIEEGYFG